MVIVITIVNTIRIYIYNNSSSIMMTMMTMMMMVMIIIMMMINMILYELNLRIWFHASKLLSDSAKIVLEYHNEPGRIIKVPELYTLGPTKTLVHSGFHEG